jgi:serine/threonine-protein kinase
LLVTTTRDRVGSVIGQRYEVLDILGRGGQGMVYRARDRWMDREVAIKVLSSKAAREPQTAERLIREQQALIALRGTSAVEVFDIFRSDEGELCLVMELLIGVDLDEYLYTIEQRNERLELARVATIFDPIVDTLEVAHNAGILHRDLKPANVFLLESGGVRLLDFGMARLKKAAPLTAAGTVMGSPSFMAPEAWLGQPELVDHRADVYSLGVILFRVLAGELPFSGESLHEKFMSTTKRARPSLVAHRPDLPRDADEWVALALAIDRDERFGNVRALWNAFLSTFRIKLPKRGQRPAFWLAAKGAVKKLAHAADRPAAPEPERRSEPSFGREALARSVMHISRPGTGETSGQEQAAAAAPVRAPAASQHPPYPIKSPPPPPRPPSAAPPPRPPSAAPPAHPPSNAPPVERTVELTENDLRPGPPPPRRPRAVPKTLDLSDSDLIVSEDTLSDPTPALSGSEAARGTPADSKPRSSGKRRNSQKRKKRSR